MKLAFIDTETTGLDPKTSVMLEFAAIVVENGIEAVRYETKIKPTTEELALAHPKALEVNGYTDEAWVDAPTIEKVAPYIGAVLDGCVLVGHNVAFDETMLKAHLNAYGIEEDIPYHKIDTITLAYEHLTPLGLKSASLDRVRDFLGWSKDGAHTAMKDVEDAKRLFDLLWQMTPEQQTDLARQLAE
jgi:DNA polymerase III epsilon subunit-like protein